MKQVSGSSLLVQPASFRVSLGVAPHSCNPVFDFHSKIDDNFPFFLW